MKKPEAFDVIVINAGASGIGVGVVLKDLGLEDFTILERHQIGESFRRWPQEMHFITPSFPSHGFGHLDLNVIAHKTSPAISFRREHLNGKQYVLYKSGKNQGIYAAITGFTGCGQNQLVGVGGADQCKIMWFTPA